MKWLSGVFGAVAAVFDYLCRRSDANNAPEVRKAETLRLEQERKESDERATRERDVKRTREQLAE